MEFKGSAYTVDKFVPMATKELRLLQDFVWKLVHDLNGSAKTVDVCTDPDFSQIRKDLIDLDSSHVISYRKHPHIDTIYVHSEYLEWNMLKLSYENRQYTYEVLLRN
jgi:hypothetical protein